MNNQMISMIMNSKNPQQFAMGMLQNYAKNNPMMANVLAMVNGGNANGVEQFARNICKENNIDADMLINQMKSYRR